MEAAGALYLNLIVLALITTEKTKSRHRLYFYLPQSSSYALFPKKPAYQLGRFNHCAFIWDRAGGFGSENITARSECHHLTFRSVCITHQGDDAIRAVEKPAQYDLIIIR